MKGDVILLFGPDALLKMEIPAIGFNIFSVFKEFSCIIPGPVLKEVSCLGRAGRKLYLTLKKVCEFKRGENIGRGSKTLSSFNERIEAFLPEKQYDNLRITKDDKLIAIARYWRHKKPKSEVIIVTEKKNLCKLASFYHISALSLDSAIELHKKYEEKELKEKRFRRHAVNTASGRWI